MGTRSAVWTGVFIGSTIGSFVPFLWGNTDFLSVAGMLWSAIGAFAGIWIAFKLTH